MATLHLDERRVRALKPRKSTCDMRDRELKGFGVRVMPLGAKRYSIHSQHQGRRVWKIVGDADTIGTDEARGRAKTLMAAIREGSDAQSATPPDIAFETVADEVFRRYARNWKPSTLTVNRGYFRNQILPWFEGRLIAEITFSDVRRWFASLHETPVAADRSAPILSVIMRQAEVYGYRPEGTNPCAGIKRYRRQGRERFLSAAELRRLGGVLSRHEVGHPQAGAPRPPRRRRGSPMTANKVSCPNCGCEEVTAQTRGFNFGKALGWGIALGPMGLVAGAHGNKKIVITCLACGHAWAPGEAAPEETTEDKPVKDEDFSHIL